MVYIKIYILGLYLSSTESWWSGTSWLISCLDVITMIYGCRDLWEYSIDFYGWMQYRSRYSESVPSCICVPPPTHTHTHTHNRVFTHLYISVTWPLFPNTRSVTYLQYAFSYLVFVSTWTIFCALFKLQWLFNSVLLFTICKLPSFWADGTNTSLKMCFHYGYFLL